MSSLAGVLLFAALLPQAAWAGAHTPPESPAPAAGNVVFEDSFFDFGKVAEGAVVRHGFKFRNTGAGAVKLLKTETSCGCTTASGALKEYAPGEAGEMEVAVDTAGKKGVIVKTVTLTLENNSAPAIALSLAMNLIPPEHPKKEKLPNLNADARCKTCHLEAGKEQQGIFLYHRVCAQCHGKKGAGASARALNDAAWQAGVSDQYLEQSIREGRPEKGMPPFVQGVAPPLDSKQVDSLVKYMREMPGNVK